MAKEIQLQSTADWNVYALIRNEDGKVADLISEAFVTYADADVARYALALTEQGTSSGYYEGDFPEWITTAGNYNVVAYRRISGSPAASDPAIGEGTVEWSGFSELGAEPLTLAEVKLHCRIDHDDEDDLLRNLIVAARQYAEAATHRTIATATKVLKLDAFPEDEGFIKLPGPPLISVSSVTYIDADGEQQTLSSSNYTVETDASNLVNPGHGLLILDAGEDWPETQDHPNAVTVTYSAGYGSPPDGLKAALKLLVAHLYKNREATTEGALATVPLAVDSLLSIFWVPEYR